jgi:hypothetical protein
VIRRGPTRSAVDDVCYMIGTYHKDVGTNNQRLYLNGIRVAEMSDTLPIALNSAAGRHVSGNVDPFNGHIDESASPMSNAPTGGSSPPGTT